MDWDLKLKPMHLPIPKANCVNLKDITDKTIENSTIQMTDRFVVTDVSVRM
jgi:hypothetical protein